MESNRPSRRAVLRTGAGVAGAAAATSLAGCSALDSVLGGGGTEVESVPAAADVALHADVDAVLDDPATRQVTNAYLSVQAQRTGYDGPESFEAMLSTFESASGLDPNGVSSLTTFWEWGGLESADGDGYFGFLFSAEWTESEVLDALEQSGETFIETEYGGKTVYEGESEYNSTRLAVVAEGEYAMAYERALEDVIDVATGDGDQFDESLREAYAATRSGPVRFAATVPADVIPESIGAGDSSFNTDLFRKVEHVAGSVYADGDRRGVETTFTATDAATADDVAALIDGFAVFARDLVDTEAAAAALDAIEASHEGEQAIVTYEQPVDELVALVETTTEPSGGDPDPAMPQAAFSFDYDGAAGGDGTGVLTVTHDGGELIPPSNLFVRGRGFATVSDVDMTFPGRWQGTVSGDYTDERTVVAGDAVDVGVRSDYDVSVVWQSSDGTASTTLARDTGPDA
jgi:hypothetical protein